MSEPNEQPTSKPKPPLGVIPERFWRIKRVEDLGEAVNRYRAAGLEPLAEWLDEIRRHEYWMKRWVAGSRGKAECVDWKQETQASGVATLAYAASEVLSILSDHDEALARYFGQYGPGFAERFEKSIEELNNAVGPFQ